MLWSNSELNKFGVNFSDVSAHEIVFWRFMDALKGIYRKDPQSYGYTALFLDTYIHKNIEPYLKDKKIKYTAKGFSLFENSEMPLRGLAKVEGKKLDPIMKYGIIHINPDMNNEMFLYTAGPFGKLSHNLTLVAYKNFEYVRKLIYGVKEYNANRIRHNRLIVNGSEETPMEKVHWDDVILPDNLHRKIRISVESFLNGRHIYERLSIPYKRGILFAGAPGNGKTMLCKAIAWESNLPFIIFQIRYGESEFGLDDAFTLANEMSPSILCLEDIDFLKKTSISMSYFLNKIDGFETLNGVLILATTNKPEEIDIALSNRPSRFDSVFRISNPDEQCRFRMLKRYFQNTFDDNTLEDIVSKTKEFTMAYLKELYLLSAMISVNRRSDIISIDDVNEALEILKQQILTGNKPLDDEREFVGFRF